MDHHLEISGMSLHDPVGVNCKRAQLLKIKAQVPDICSKGCVLDNCVGII